MCDGRALGTSGVLLLAKTRLAAAELAEMFRTEQVLRLASIA